MIGYLQVGKIINTHGVRGEVKVMPLTDYPKRFEKLKNKKIFILKENSVEENLVQESKKLSISDVKYFKDKVILKFNEINTMEEAKLLKNTFLVISRDDAVKLPDGHYFICDLIGCEVLDVNRGILGKIEEVFQTGSNDVYVLKDENGIDTLIPVLKTIIKSVDIENKKIIVDLPEDF